MPEIGSSAAHNEHATREPCPEHGGSPFAGPVAAKKSATPEWLTTFSKTTPQLQQPSPSTSPSPSPPPPQYVECVCADGSKERVAEYKLCKIKKNSYSQCEGPLKVARVATQSPHSGSSAACAYNRSESTTTMRMTPEKPELKALICKTCGERDLDKFHAANVRNRIAMCATCRAETRKTCNSKELEKARKEGKWTCRHCGELPVDSFTPSLVAINLHLCRGCHSATRMELKARRRREAETANKISTEERRRAIAVEYAVLVEANEVQLQDALMRSYVEGEEQEKRRRTVRNVLNDDNEHAFVKWDGHAMATKVKATHKKTQNMVVALPCRNTKRCIRDAERYNRDAHI
jgi:hypothetical protein